MEILTLRCDDHSSKVLEEINLQPNIEKVILFKKYRFISSCFKGVIHIAQQN